jgi:hypothetical protein
VPGGVVTRWLYPPLNLALHGVHLVVVGVNLFGWLFAATLRANVVVLGLTLLSWFGLGWRFGVGYCLVTDLHWRLKRWVGERPHTDSWVKYALDAVSGRDLDAAAVERLTFALFFAGIACSVAANVLGAPW